MPDSHLVSSVSINRPTVALSHCRVGSMTCSRDVVGAPRLMKNAANEEAKAAGIDADFCRQPKHSKSLAQLAETVTWWICKTALKGV